MPSQGGLDFLVNLACSCGMYFSVAKYWAKNITTVNAEHLHRSGDCLVESCDSETMEVLPGRTNLTWNFRRCSAKLQNNSRCVKWEAAAWFVTSSIDFLARVQDTGTTALLKILVSLSVGLECELLSLTADCMKSYSQTHICKSW